MSPPFSHCFFDTSLNLRKQKQKTAQERTKNWMLEQFDTKTFNSNSRKHLPICKFSRNPRKGMKTKDICKCICKGASRSDNGKARQTNNANGKQMNASPMKGKPKGSANGKHCKCKHGNTEGNDNGKGVGKPHCGTKRERERGNIWKSDGEALLMSRMQKTLWSLTSDMAIQQSNLMAHCAEYRNDAYWNPAKQYARMATRGYCCILFELTHYPLIGIHEGIKDLATESLREGWETGTQWSFGKKHITTEFIILVEISVRRCGTPMPNPKEFKKMMNMQVSHLD